jgi:glycosyltransferase involved in cell wall biosynthesis
MDISVIIPVFNEEDNILPLSSQLRRVLSKTALKYEIIFVDDNSKDATARNLEKVCKKDRHVKFASLRANSGQTAAMKAGVDLSSGKVIIFMDGDLQNDPEDIPALLRRMREGYDVVSGWRKYRKDSMAKKVPSKISNWMARKITGVNLHDFGCTLKAYKRECFENLGMYGEMHRYLPAFLVWRGYSIAEIPVNHRPRIMGKTKYGFSRLFRGSMDLINMKLIMKYYNRPNHLLGSLGIIQFVIGLVIGLYLLGIKLLYNVSIAERPLLILSVLLLVMGVQFITLGFLGGIIVKMNYDRTEVKPYSIKRKVNI